MAYLMEWPARIQRAGVLGVTAVAALMAGLSRSEAQFAQEVQPGDTIVYVQPQRLERSNGVPVRRLAPREGDDRLVYEYDNPNGVSSRERLAVDPQPILRDMQRVHKKNARKRKPTQQPRVASRTPATSDADIKPAPAQETPIKAALPAVASPVAPAASAPVHAEAAPREDRKVRVIPLYKVPTDTTGEGAAAAR
ncbi:MAG: hypothetical protein JWM36_95 [Hyphomicrobiales bacterium]|nr:hypothetical protein [Hyphomicrobiales bacterium]